MYTDAPASKTEWDKVSPPRSGGAASPKRSALSPAPRRPAPQSERPAQVPEKTEPPAEKTERPSGPSEQEAKPEQQPASKEEKPRKGFLRRHPLMAGVGLIALVVAAAGYVYWDNSSHFQSTDDAFIAARQFAIADRGLRYRGSGHRQPACQQGRPDRQDRPARLPDGARPGPGSSGGGGSRDPQRRYANLDPGGADRRRPGTGDPGAGKHGACKSDLGRDQPLVNKGWATAQQGTTDVQNLKAQQATVDSAQAALKVAQRQIDTLIAMLLPAGTSPAEEQAARFDIVGFLLVATFLGSLEIVLDRGLEDLTGSPQTLSSYLRAFAPWPLSC